MGRTLRVAASAIFYLSAISAFAQSTSGVIEYDPSGQANKTIQVGQVFKCSFASNRKDFGFKIQVDQATHITIKMISDFGTDSDPKVSALLGRETKGFARIHHSHGGLLDFDAEPGNYLLSMHSSKVGDFYFVAVAGDAAMAADVIAAARQKGVSTEVQSASAVPSSSATVQQPSANATSSSVVTLDPNTNVFSAASGCAELKIGQAYEVTFNSKHKRLYYCVRPSEAGEGSLFVTSDKQQGEDPMVDALLTSSSAFGGFNYNKRKNTVSMKVDTSHSYSIQLVQRNGNEGKIYFVFVMGDKVRAATAFGEAFKARSQEGSQSATAVAANTMPAASSGEAVANAPIASTMQSAAELPAGVNVEYTQGVGIVAVKPDSPAARAGLKPGDIILAVNGVDVVDAPMYVRALRAIPDGEAMKLSVLRDTSMIETSVTPESIKGNKITGIGIHTVVASDMPVTRMRGRVIITREDKDYPGFLRIGDVVESLDGSPVNSVDEIRPYMVAHQGQEVKVKVMRGGQPIEVSHKPLFWQGGKRAGRLAWDYEASTTIAPITNPGSFPRKWPTFFEVPASAGANEVQRQDLATLKQLRDSYLKLVSPSFKPVAVIQLPVRTEIFCSNNRGPVELRSSVDPRLPFSGQELLVRLADASCGGQASGTTTGLIIRADGSWRVGQFSLQKGSVVATPVGTFVNGIGNQTDLYNEASQLLLREDAEGNMLLRAGAEPLTVGVAAGTIFLRDVGFIDGEIANVVEFRTAPTSVVRAADDSYRIAGPLKVTPPRGLLASYNFGEAHWLEFDGALRFDTKTDTTIGPAGTYLFSGKLPLGSMPLADEVQPAPGTLAKYAAASKSCALQPPVPNGWLMWAPNCADDPDHADVWSVNGRYRIRYSKGSDPVLQAFDPATPALALREWQAKEFSNSIDPSPVGVATMSEFGSPIFRGNFQGLTPNGDGTCFVAGDASTTSEEPCTFEGDRRVDTLYLARIEQQKLDVRSQQLEADAKAALRRNDEDRKQLVREQQEQARLQEQQRLAEIRAEKQARSARRSAMFGAIMTGLSQVSNEYAATMQQQAIQQQQQQAALMAARQAADLKRQQDEAASRNQAAQQQAKNAENLRLLQQQIADQQRLAEQRRAQQQQTSAASRTPANAQGTTSTASQQQNAQAVGSQRTPVNRPPAQQPNVNMNIGTNTIVMTPNGQGAQNSQPSSSDQNIARARVAPPCPGPVGSYSQACPHDREKPKPPVPQTQNNTVAYNNTTNTRSTNSTAPSGSVPTPPPASYTPPSYTPPAPDPAEEAKTRKRNYDEVLVLCMPELDSNKKPVLSCRSSMRDGQWLTYSTTGSALNVLCASGYSHWDYGKKNGYEVRGCGYGVDFSNPKLTRRFGDIAAAFNIDIPERRIFRCSWAEIGDDSVCDKY